MEEGVYTFFVGAGCRPQQKSIYSEEALQDSAAQVSPIDAGASLAAWGGSPLGEAVG